MTRLCKIVAASVLAVCIAPLCVSEVKVGTPQHGTFGGGPDIVNLANLNAHWKFPVFSKAGRGVPFSYVITHDTSVWFLAGVSGNGNWLPVSNWAWRRRSEERRVGKECRL